MYVQTVKNGTLTFYITLNRFFHKITQKIGPGIEKGGRINNNHYVVPQKKEFGC